jgi:hypothetical protein
LSYVAPNLVLVPQNGNGLSINGSLYQIPVAGASVAPGGPGLNYIYGFAQNNLVALEANGAAPTLNSDGVMIKTGDPTRTLVGKAYVNQYGQWQDQDGFIGVLSWYNRRPKVSITSPLNNINTGAANVWMELSTAMRNYFLCWPDEAVEVQISANAGGTGNTGVQIGSGFDGGTVEPHMYLFETDYLGGNYPLGFVLTFTKTGLAGNILRYGNMMILQWAGSAFWYGSSSGSYPSVPNLTLITRG